MHKNPFIYNTPITQIENIVGREQETFDLVQRLISHTNLRMFGQRGIGKTTFLYKLKDALSKEKEPWQMIIVNLENAASLTSFNIALDQALILDKQIPKNTKRVIKNQHLEIEKNKSIKIKELGVSKNTKKLASYDEEKIYEKLLVLTTKIPNLVIVFDECQTLGRWQDPNSILSVIRNVFLENNDRNNTSIIMTGSQPTAVEKLLNGSSHSPFWSRTEKYDLLPIAQHEWFDWIEAKSIQSNKPFSEEAIDLLLTLTNKHSLTIQKLSRKAWDTTTKNVENFNIKDAWENLLNEEGYVYRNKLRDMKPHHKNFIHSFVEKGPEKLTSRERIYDYGFQDSTEIIRAKKELLELGILTEHFCLEVADPLLKEWIIKNPMV